MATTADWQYLSSSAIDRRHNGDIYGAIEDMNKAINLAKTMPNLAKETAIDLNYLADMYLECKAIAEAEVAIREAVELSRSSFPGLLADNLLGLAVIQELKGEYREALMSAKEARRSYLHEGQSYGVGRAEELIEQIKANISLTS